MGIERYIPGRLRAWWIAGHIMLWPAIHHACLALRLGRRSCPWEWPTGPSPTPGLRTWRYRVAWPAVTRLAEPVSGASAGAAARRVASMVGHGSPDGRRIVTMSAAWS